MEFETVERCGRVRVVKNGVESASCAARIGDEWGIYISTLQHFTVTKEIALAFIAEQMDTWHTASQAAEVLVEMGVFDEPPSAQRVTKWCRDGLLPGAFKLLGPGARGSGGAWRIPEAALQAFVERRRQ